MKKVATPKRSRNLSNVEAVGVTPHGVPGVRDSSAHGSDVRRWLTVAVSNTGDWCVVLLEADGDLYLENVTILVRCESLLDASQELAAWSHGMNLPYRDYNAPAHETQDPVAGWPGEVSRG